MFFSEEKNQKTFVSAHMETSRPWPDSWNSLKLRVFFLFASLRALSSRQND